MWTYLWTNNVCLTSGLPSKQSWAMGYGYERAMTSLWSPIRPPERPSAPSDLHHPPAGSGFTLESLTSIEPPARVKPEPAGGWWRSAAGSPQVLWDSRVKPYPTGRGWRPLWRSYGAPEWSHSPLTAVAHCPALLVHTFTDLCTHLQICPHVQIDVWIYRFIYTFTDQCRHLHICPHICTYVHTFTDLCKYLSIFAFTSVNALTILNTHLQIFVQICKSYYSLTLWNTDTQLFIRICK